MPELRVSIGLELVYEEEAKDESEAMVRDVERRRLDNLAHNTEIEWRNQYKKAQKRKERGYD